MIGDTKTSWMQVTRGRAQGLVLGHSCLKSGSKRAAHGSEYFSGNAKMGNTIPKPWQYSKYNFISKTSFKMKDGMK